MKMVITGASGPVGRQLVKQLLNSQVELLLVGRSIEKLHQLFPNCSSCTYDELSSRGKDADLLVHLAAKNNNSDGKYEDFEAVNVVHACKVFEQARRSGVKRFVYVSTFHCLDPWRKSHYSKSKEDGARAIFKLAEDGELLVLYLPAIYGEELSGKLKLLNFLPFFMTKPSLKILSAFRPTVSINKLSRFLINEAVEFKRNSVFIVDGQTTNSIYCIASRSLDIFFVLFVTFGFGWLLALIWIAVKVDSPGPGFFVQDRVGKHTKPFKCWKFRTMTLGTKQAGSHEVSTDAITRVGGFLRRYKLDELPQVWNILRNEVSLIGPRPCLLTQQDLIKERIRLGVFKIKPGISGLSQVEGIDMRNPKKLAARDSEYVAMKSLLIDIRIIIATALGRGVGDQATNKRSIN